MSVAHHTKEVKLSAEGERTKGDPGGWAKARDCSSTTLSQPLRLYYIRFVV